LKGEKALGGTTRLEVVDKHKMIVLKVVLRRASSVSAKAGGRVPLVT